MVPKKRQQGWKFLMDIENRHAQKKSVKYTQFTY